MEKIETYTGDFNSLSDCKLASTKKNSAWNRFPVDNRIFIFMIIIILTYLN